MKQYKVAIYCRVANECEVSIEQQRLLLLAYAREMGYSSTITYLDNGFSGNNLNRPAMEQLEKDTLNRKVDTVIVKDLSRVSRNMIQCQEWYRRMYERGINVISRGNTALQLPLLQKNS